MLYGMHVRARVQVDVAGFQREMEAQRQRSKDSREIMDLTAQASHRRTRGPGGAGGRQAPGDEGGRRYRERQGGGEEASNGMKAAAAHSQWPLMACCMRL